MRSLLEAGLGNAALALLPAAAALVAARWGRRPALTWTLWLLVLIKLVTPPLVPLPLLPPVAPGAGPAGATGAAPEPAPTSSAGDEDPAAEPDPPAAGLAFTRLDALRPDADGKVAPPGMAGPPALPAPAPRRAAAPRPARAPGPPRPASAPARKEPAWPAKYFPELLASLWLGGSAVYLLVAARRALRFRGLLRRTSRATPELTALVADLSARLALPRPPRAALVPGPLPPLLWALGRPTLYFPEGLWLAVGPESREALVLHELAHLARGDHRVRRLELAVLALYWWHPLAWMAGRRLRAAEEECCDAWVVRAMPGRAAAYAAALLETVDFLARHPAALPPAASGFGGGADRTHDLKRRLTMIVRGTPPGGLSLAGRLLVLGLALLLPLAAGRARPAAPPGPAAPVRPTAPDPAEEEPAGFKAPGRPLMGGGGQVWGLAVSPDGKRAAWACGDAGDRPGDLVLWDLAARREVAAVRQDRALRCVAWSPDGAALATGDVDHKVQLRDPATGRVTRTLAGHAGAVSALAFLSPTRLVSAGLDNTLRVWDLPTGAALRTLTGHAEGVLGVAASPDGRRIASASRDGTARVWDSATGACLLTLTGHRSAVEGVAFSPDGAALATASHDGTVRLWDARTGKQVRELTGHAGVVSAVAYAADGKTVASAGADRTVRLWDPTSGAALGTLTGHADRVNGLAFRPGTQELFTGAWDRTVRQWDALTQAELASLRSRLHDPDAAFPLLGIACSPDGRTLAVAGEDRTVHLLDRGGKPLHLLSGHDDVVAGVAFSPDGALLATASFDGTVKLWEVGPGKLRRTLTGHAGWVFAVAFSPDGKLLGSAGYDRTARVWSVETGRQTLALGKHRGGVRCLAFSPDGARLATGGTDRAVRVWRVRDGELEQTLKGHEEGVRGLAFAPSGGRLLSGSEDGSVRLWDVAGGKQVAVLAQLGEVRAVAFSPRGKLAACALMGGPVRLLDPATLASRSTLPGHPGGTTGLAFAPGAQALLSAGLDRQAREWESTPPERPAGRSLAEQLPGKPEGEAWFARYSPDGRSLLTGGGARVLRLHDADLARPLGKLAGVPAAVYGAAWSPDGRTLATGHHDQAVRLWDAATGKVRATLEGHRHRVWAVAFTPDGRTLVSAAGSWEQPSEVGEVKLWDVSTGKEFRALEGLTASVQAAAVSPDGRTLAVGARDGNAWLFDLATGKLRVKLAGHKDAVRSAAFSPAGATAGLLATGCVDGKVRLWSPGGKLLATAPASPGGVNSVAWSPDGRLLAATAVPGAGAEVVESRVWEVTAGAGGASARERLVLTGHQGSALCCAFSPDGKFLATGGGQYERYGSVTLHDAATGRRVAALAGHGRWVEALAFRPDGVLASAGGSATGPGEVYQWQAGARAGWAVADAHAAVLTAGAFSRDGRLVATGCLAGQIKLWDAATGAPLRTLAGHGKAVRGLAFSPDGLSLASAGDDGTGRTWDVATGGQLSAPARHAAGARSVAYSPDGRRLAFAFGDLASPKEPGATVVVDVASGKPLAGEWASQAGITLAFSPDGGRLAVGGPGGSPALRVYEVPSGRRVAEVAGTVSVRCLAFSPDGLRLATGHGSGGARGEGAVQVWDARTWREQLVLTGGTRMTHSVGFSPDGRDLAAAGVEGGVRVWALADQR